ncbi:hypothetical protein CAOG_010059 [Capsaspora owczarzaki ATCC 30864]|uniref:Uncharacterized protein n=1 Tax=Capsaspora owczarzaki (strain ATCC 30864) TaxID=595528 RepID=A0A0D2WWG9_CAPO3|nr:hypothetical protein CAOG_010059 [Capsaspora owczarzaki ATCC 30864]
MRPSHPTPPQAARGEHARVASREPRQIEADQDFDDAFGDGHPSQSQPPPRRIEADQDFDDAFGEGHPSQSQPIAVSTVNEIPQHHTGAARVPAAQAESPAPAMPSKYTFRRRGLDLPMLGGKTSSMDFDAANSPSNTTAKPASALEAILAKTAFVNQLLASDSPAIENQAMPVSSRGTKLPLADAHQPAQPPTKPVSPAMPKPPASVSEPASIESIVQAYSSGASGVRTRDLARAVIPQMQRDTAVLKANLETSARADLVAEGKSPVSNMLAQANLTLLPELPPSYALPSPAAPRAISDNSARPNLALDDKQSSLPLLGAPPAASASSLFTSPLTDKSSVDPSLAPDKRAQLASVDSARAKLNLLPAPATLDDMGQVAAATTERSVASLSQARSSTSKPFLTKAALALKAGVDTRAAVQPLHAARTPSRNSRDRSLKAEFADLLAPNMPTPSDDDPVFELPPAIDPLLGDSTAPSQSNDFDEKLSAAAAQLAKAVATDAVVAAKERTRNAVTIQDMARTVYDSVALPHVRVSAASPAAASTTTPALDSEHTKTPLPSLLDHLLATPSFAAAVVAAQLRPSPRDTWQIAPPSPLARVALAAATRRLQALADQPPLLLAESGTNNPSSSSNPFKKEDAFVSSNEESFALLLTSPPESQESVSVLSGLPVPQWPTLIPSDANPENALQLLTLPPVSLAQAEMTSQGLGESFFVKSQRVAESLERAITTFEADKKRLPELIYQPAPAPLTPQLLEIFNALPVQSVPRPADLLPRDEPVTPRVRASEQLSVPEIEALIQHERKTQRFLSVETAFALLRRLCSEDRALEASTVLTSHFALIDKLPLSAPLFDTVAAGLYHEDKLEAVLGLYDEMIKVLHERPSQELCHIAIRAAGKMQLAERAKKISEDMSSFSHVANDSTYVALIGAYARRKDYFSAAFETGAQLAERGYRPEESTLRGLMHAASVAGNIRVAHQLWSVLASVPGFAGDTVSPSGVSFPHPRIVELMLKTYASALAPPTVTAHEADVQIQGAPIEDVTERSTNNFILQHDRLSILDPPDLPKALRAKVDRAGHRYEFGIGAAAAAPAIVLEREARWHKTVAKHGVDASLAQRHLFFPSQARPDLCFLTEFAGLPGSPDPASLTAAPVAAAIAVPALLRSPVPLLPRFSVFHDTVDAMIEHERRVRSVRAQAAIASVQLLAEDEEEAAAALEARVLAMQEEDSTTAKPPPPSAFGRMLVGLGHAMLNDMVSADVLPTPAILNALLFIYLNDRRLTDALAAYKTLFVDRFRVQPNATTFRSLLASCNLSRRLDLAELVFNERNSVLFGTHGADLKLTLNLIHLAARTDRLDKAVAYLNLLVDVYQHVPRPEQLQMLRTRALALGQPDVWRKVVDKCRALGNSELWTDPKPVTFSAKAHRAFQASRPKKHQNLLDELPKFDRKEIRETKREISQMRRNAREFGALLHEPDSNFKALEKLQTEQERLADKRKRWVRNLGSNSASSASASFVGDDSPRAPSARHHTRGREGRGGWERSHSQEDEPNHDLGSSATVPTPWFAQDRDAVGSRLDLDRSASAGIGRGGVKSRVRGSVASSREDWAERNQRNRAEKIRASQEFVPSQHAAKRSGRGYRDARR